MTLDLLIPDSTVRITRVGLGCARLFGGVERRASARLIEAALGAGIRHFDTAPAYGSEDVIGDILAGVSDITIATKVGIPRPPEGGTIRKVFLGPVYRRTIRPLLARAPGAKAALLRVASARRKPRPSQPPRSLGRAEVMQNLEESLHRLRRTCIDLYLLHEPEHLQITEELRELFDALKARGMIGAFGLAYGGKATRHVRFQQRHDADDAGHSPAGCAQIYHGVLRHGRGEAGDAGDRLRAPMLIRNVLDRDPHCAVIVSASSPAQITEVGQWAGNGRSAVRAFT